MKLIDVVRRLHGLGHAPEFPAITEDFLVWAVSDLAEELIRRYQEFHGLPRTGKPCPITVEHLLRPRCGHPDVMALSARGVSQWGVRDLRYFQTIAYPSVDPAAIAADYAEAWRRMTAVCGLTAAAAEASSAANVLAISAPIDGPFNVLAMSELPPPDAGRGTVLHQTFDPAETALTHAQRVAMMAHEIGHALGLGHAQPGSGNLMEPVLGSIDHPQAGDVAELQARYGTPATPPVPTPQSPPASPTTPPEPAPPVGEPTAGPEASTVLMTCPEAGSYRYDFHFPNPGVYLVVIVPLR